MQTALRADQGSGPTVVYVPGIDGSGDLLLGTGDRLAARFRLIRCRYEARPGGVESYAALAESLVALFEERGVGRAVLLAESFGGAVALHAALAHPDRVAGLVLVNTFARYRSRLRLLASRALAPLVPRALFALGRRFGAPHALFGRLREAAALAEFRALPGAPFDRAYRARLRLLHGLEMSARLAEVRVPALVVVGDADRIVAPAEGRALAAALPDAVLETVVGGGHALLPLAALPWVDWVSAVWERAAAE